MKDFNFDERIVRRGTNCVKWDEKPEENIIPLWVADMDFRVAPAIQQAIERRAAHGVFGYTHVPEAYYEAIISSSHQLLLEGHHHARRESAHSLARL